MLSRLIRGLGAGWGFGVLALGGFGCVGAQSSAQAPEGAVKLSLELEKGGVATSTKSDSKFLTELSKTEPLLNVLVSQLTRNFAELKKAPEPVYFLGYSVNDREGHAVSASDGAVVESRTNRSRQLDVEVRLGDHKFDSSHRLPGEGSELVYPGSVSLPLSDLDVVMRNDLWLATAERYEAARQRYMQVVASRARETQDDKGPIADFSVEPPVQYVEAAESVALDVSKWEQRLSKLSTLSKLHPKVLRSSVALESTIDTRYSVNSEGSVVKVPRSHVRIGLSAEAIAADGLPIEQFAAIEAPSIGGLPGDDVIAARFEAVLNEVEALLAAPMIEPYVGPAILDGRAAGVFFHEVFGHRIEGHRQDDEAEGQTFATRIGQAVMPGMLSVFDDPSVRRLNGVELNGYYPVDDEAVPAQRVDLVQGGVLKTFLLSRAPARGFERSNGHGRRSPAHPVVARQANLVVQPAQAVSPKQLKAALIEEVVRQGLPYGLRFTDITGGYTQTQRSDTQAFKVIPVLVYRVYPDGREELVRGVDIEGTPLTVLSKIVAAANDFQVFNGICGAESGWVPVSATSPSLLLSQIEVARQELTELRPPILPNPASNESAPVPAAGVKP